jgi:hypothetical protein
MTCSLPCFLDRLFELLDGLGAFTPGGAVISQHQFQLG